MNWILFYILFSYIVGIIGVIGICIERIHIFYFFTAWIAAIIPPTSVNLFLLIGWMGLMSMGDSINLLAFAMPLLIPLLQALIGGLLIGLSFLDEFPLKSRKVKIGSVLVIWGIPPCIAFLFWAQKLAA